jgi:hypothetical protein
MIGAGKEERHNMRTTHQFHPSCGDRLEDRINMSQMPGTLPMVPVPAIRAAAVQAAPVQLDLSGTIAGTAAFLTPSPFVGKVFTISGTGTVASMGQVNVTGYITLAGHLGQTSDRGALFLSNSQGSVSLLISRPKGSQTWSFKLYAATGAFQGDTATGTAQLTLPSDNVSLRPGTGSIVKQPFTLTLSHS